MKGAGGAHPPPPPEMTSGFLIQLAFCKKKTMWFIGVEVEQETSSPPPKKILDPPMQDLLILTELHLAYQVTVISIRNKDY